MNRRNLIVLSALAAILIGVWMVALGTFPSGREERESKQDPSEALWEDAMVWLRMASAIHTQPDTFSYDDGGRRDPMVPLGKRSIRTRVPSKPRWQPPTLSLRGIFWDAEDPLALIGETTVRRGDTVKGAKVTRITRDTVVLLYRGRSFTLKLEPKRWPGYTKAPGGR